MGPRKSQRAARGPDAPHGGFTRLKALESRRGRHLQGKRLPARWVTTRACGWRRGERAVLAEEKPRVGGQTRGFIEGSRGSVRLGPEGRDPPRLPDLSELLGVLPGDPASPNRQFRRFSLVPVGSSLFARHRSRGEGRRKSTERKGEGRNVHGSVYICSLCCHCAPGCVNARILLWSLGPREWTSWGKNEPASPVDSCYLGKFKTRTRSC